MTLNEMISKILEVCPNASVGEDNDGQIVIYTNKRIDVSTGSEDLLEFESSDYCGSVDECD